MTPAAQQQVLEALRELVACHTESAGFTMSMVADKAAFTAMLEASEARVAAAVENARAALAAAQPVEAEPVAWMTQNSYGDLSIFVDECQAIRYAALSHGGLTVHALYDSPNPAKAVALTDADLICHANNFNIEVSDSTWLHIARAIERAVWAANKLEAP